MPGFLRESVVSVCIKYFASLSERLGRSEDTITLEDKMTVADVWDQVTEGEKFAPNILSAVNQEYVDRTYLVSEGDEVAFFPPVTGG